MAKSGYARAAIVALACAAAARPATAQDDIASKAINRPGLSWTVSGSPVKTVKDAHVAGGHAMQVVVAVKGANPWAISASAPIEKGVAKGDKLVLAFYARVAAAADDKTDLPAMIQLGADPYTPVISGTVSLTTEWQLVQINGRADADHAPGTIIADLHLAGDAHTVQLGPIYVLDLGQNG